MSVSPAMPVPMASAPAAHQPQTHVRYRVSQDERPTLFTEEAKGCETPSSRLYLHCNAWAVQGWEKELAGEPTHVVLILSVEDCAKLVRDFFWPVTWSGRGKRWLQQLLRLRYAACTSPFAKSESAGHDRLERYDRF